MSGIRIVTVLNDNKTFTDSDKVITCAVSGDTIEEIEEQLYEDREELLFYTEVLGGKVNIHIVDPERVVVHDRD